MEKPHPFSSGAEAWVVSETEGRFYQRLNWLSNFSISKSVKHQTLKIPSEITEILENCELKDLDFAESADRPTDDSILLIGAEPFFPCRWILVSPLNKKNVGPWAKKLNEALKNLNVKTARIFYSKTKQKIFETEANFRDVDVTLLSIENDDSWT